MACIPTKHRPYPSQQLKGIFVFLALNFIFRFPINKSGLYVTVRLPIIPGKLDSEIQRCVTWEYVGIEIPADDGEGTHFEANMLVLTTKRFWRSMEDNIGDHKKWLIVFLPKGT